MISTNGTEENREKESDVSNGHRGAESREEYTGDAAAKAKNKSRRKKKKGPVQN